MSGPHRATIMIGVGAATIGAVVGAATYAALSDDKAQALSIAPIYDDVSPGVVEITATVITKPPLAPERVQAQGSGWMYDDQGDIITNEHVVEDADTLSVRLSDGSVYSATLVGSEGSADLAVIKVDAPASLLHPLDVGDSDALHVGDGVVVIGNPLGLVNTTTSGIVSALHREFEAGNGRMVEDGIQTDAAINGGNSGSPLLNAKGEVVGVAARNEGEGGSDGLGFAIPSRMVASLVTRLISNR